MSCQPIDEGVGLENIAASVFRCFLFIIANPYRTAEFLGDLVVALKYHNMISYESCQE